MHGLSRPNAILVPQRAVQGVKSHFVWLLDKDGKTPHEQVVEVGDWLGDNWFISDGLHAGDRVIVDGAVRVANGVAVKVSSDVPAIKVPEGGPVIQQKPAEAAK